jgi:hypothetical protein
MPTRRQTLGGVIAVVLGGAGATVGAFSSSTEASADMRVVVESELRLIPAPDRFGTPDGDPGDEAYEYLDTDDDGEIQAFEFQHLNRRAVTDFGELAEIVNNGDLSVDHFELSFTATDADGDPLPAVAGALTIVGDAASGPTTDGVYTLLAGGDELEPGEGVTFGLGVNLLSDRAPGSIEDLPPEDSPDADFSVTLHIDAIRE